MVNRLGGIRQLAMVVKDADRAMHYLAETLGIGPFYVTRDYVPDDFRYRGRAAPAPVRAVRPAEGSTAMDSELWNATAP